MAAQASAAPAVNYSRTARLFHWVTAVLALCMIAAGFTMIREDLSRPLQDTLFIFHKNTGLLVFTIVLARLAYRLMHPPPPLPATMPDWQRIAARVSHLALYTLLILMPIAGYIRVKAGDFPIETLDAMGVPPLVEKSEPVAEIAKTLHFYFAWALTLTITVHVTAAAYHGLIRRDGVFSRMWLWQ